MKNIQTCMLSTDSHKQTRHWEPLLQLCQDRSVFHNIFFCKKTTQMFTTQCLTLFVIYGEGFIINTRFKSPIVVDKETSFT